MSPCPRCRAVAVPGDAWCGQCGVRLQHPAPAFPSAAPAGLTPRTSAPVAVGPRRPGAITAARVLIVLGVVGDIAWAFGGFAFAVVGSRFGDAISRGGDDGGAGAAIAALSRWLMLLSVLLLVSAAVGIWAYRGIGGRSRTARSVLTTLHILDVLGALAIAAGFGLDAVGLLVVALPAKTVLLVLLWGPEGSRRWFTDPPSGTAPGPPDALDSPTVQLAPARDRSREPGDQRLGAVPLVLAGVVVVALLVVAGLAINSERRPDPATVAAGLQACARTFQQEWGAGLASASGEHKTVAAVGLAIANGSFDTPSGTPRRILNQVYQTQDRAGNMLTTVSDRHIAAALADPRFTRCSAEASSLRGDEVGALAVFGCVPRTSGPFRMDC